MRDTYEFLKWLRNLYVGLLVIPLWLWSAYYRIDPSFIQFPHIFWIERDWNLLCVLVFTHGSLTLWQYVEKLTDAFIQKKPFKILVGSVWALAITLFITGIGAILKSDGIAWGYGLLAAGTIGLPLFVFWIYGFTVFQRKEIQEHLDGQSVDQVQIETEAVPPVKGKTLYRSIREQ